MEKKIILLLIVVVILVGLLSTMFLKDADTPDVSTQGEISQTENNQEVSLVINYGEGSPLIYKIEFENGITAFDLLEEKLGEVEIDIITKNYDFGIFIEAIGNKTNGEEGKYWLYYINGEMSQVSADKREIETGDKIEFKFEKSPF